MFANIPPRMTLPMRRLRSLQDEVVGLRTKNPVGTDNDSLTVINVRLEALEPVSARPGEAVEAQSSTASEHLVLKLIGLEGSVEFPSTVRGEEIVWRDEDLESVLFRGLEDALHVFDGLGLSDAVADRPHARPLSLKTSFCGSMKTTAVVVFVYIHCVVPFLLILALTGFRVRSQSASLELRGFECWRAGSARHFLLLQELSDPTGDLFPVRLERKMTRVE